MRHCFQYQQKAEGVSNPPQHLSYRRTLRGVKNKLKKRRLTNAFQQFANLFAGIFLGFI
jgi:hypothetical protein